MKFFNLIFIILCSQAHAQDASMFAPPGTDKYNVSFEHLQLSAPDSNPEIGIIEQKVTFGMPIYVGEQSSLAFTAKGQRTQLSDSFAFPKSNAEVPTDFASADIGFAWSRNNLYFSKVSVSATYGNAGTRLFTGEKGESDDIVSLTIFGEDKKDTGSWLYYLSYSNNRTTWNGIPIPGFAYTMNRKEFTGVFGIPFMFVNWRPESFTLSAMLSPFVVSTEIATKPLAKQQALQVYANIGWYPKSYKNAVKLEDDDERLILDRKEVGAGVRYNFEKIGNISVAYVYDFDRKFMIGESISDKDAEELTIADTAGFQIKLKGSFY